MINFLPFPFFSKKNYNVKTATFNTLSIKIILVFLPFAERRFECVGFSCPKPVLDSTKRT